MIFYSSKTKKLKAEQSACKAEQDGGQQINMAAKIATIM